MCLFVLSPIVFFLGVGNESFSASSSGILIPLYVFPANDTSWQPLIDAKINHPEVPIIAIVNTNSGPGKFQDEQYSEQIPRLVEVGIKPIGYVTTQGASKPVEDVKAEIDTWKALYPSIEGIFFDEMSNLPGNESYYSELSAYAKSIDGFDFTVGNPGVDTIPSYVGTVDNIVIHENNLLPSLVQLNGWHASFDKNNFSYLVHSLPLVNTQYIADSSNHVKFMYITNNQLDFITEFDPWDTISSHFEVMIHTLDEPSVGITIESRDFTGELITSTNNVEISSNNIAVSTGSSPLFYNATKNIQYTISVSDFGNFTFAHWENFDTNPTRIVTPLQNTTMIAFYKNVNDDMSDIPLQTNVTGATVGKNLEECFLINGNGILESGICEVKTVTVNNKSGLFIAKFQLDVTPNSNRIAKHFSPDDIPDFQSFFSTCDWRDANGNMRSTESWKETVSASGNAVLTCIFKD